MNQNELFFWTWFSVLPHAVIHLSACISARGNSHIRVYFRMRKYTRICEFPRAEIHAERCITACGNTLNQVQKNSGYTHFWVHFHKWKITIISVNPHMRKIKVWWISSSWEIHLFSCISAWGNTLFLMREFAWNSVSPHAVIHWTLWKSTQRNYTFSGALPQLEIHNNKSISSYAETYILVNFLILENSHFLVYIRMR